MIEKQERAFKAPINTSIDKNIYSFSKSDRFTKVKPGSCKSQFYNPRDNRQMRSTSFGFGSKVDIINKEQGAPPGSYDSHSAFIVNKQKQKGFSFSHNPRVTFEHMVQGSNPGPGKYVKHNSSISKTAYSLRSKYQDPMQRMKNKLGPGQYNAFPLITKSGIYCSSKYKNSKCGRIGNGPRFDDDSTLSPGPGNYEDVMAMNSNGNYTSSKINSLFVKTFQGTSRPPINGPSFTPGPGAYYYFSGFSPKN